MRPEREIGGVSSYDWETRFGAYGWDAETGMYHERHWYLHPGLGRWRRRIRLVMRAAIACTILQNTPAYEF